MDIVFDLERNYLDEKRITQCERRTDWSDKYLVGGLGSTLIQNWCQIALINQPNSGFNSRLTSEGHRRGEFVCCGWKQPLCDWMSARLSVCFPSLTVCICIYMWVLEDIKGTQVFPTSPKCYLALLMFFFGRENSHFPSSCHLSHSIKTKTGVWDNRCVHSWFKFRCRSWTACTLLPPSTCLTPSLPQPWVLRKLTCSALHTRSRNRHRL